MACRGSAGNKTRMFEGKSYHKVCVCDTKSDARNYFKYERQRIFKKYGERMHYRITPYQDPRGGELFYFVWMEYPTRGGRRFRGR